MRWFFKLLKFVFLAHGAAVPSCPEPYGEQVNTINSYCVQQNRRLVLENRFLIEWLFNYWFRLTISQAYAHPDNCDQFFLCTNGTLTLETCENGLLFDGKGAVHNHCNYNWAVECGTRKFDRKLNTTVDNNWLTPCKD